MAASRRRSSNAPRRRRVWADARLASIGLTNGVVQTTDLLQNFRANGGITLGCTIQRIVFRHMFSTVTIGNSAGLVDVGFIVTDKTNTSLNPNTSPHEDWMWNDQRSILAPEFGGAFYGAAAPALSESAYYIDTPVARRCEELGDSLLCQVVVNTAGVSNRFHSRVLLLLP